MEELLGVRRTFVINLEEHAARLNGFLARFARQGMTAERFPAVAGKRDETCIAAADAPTL